MDQRPRKQLTPGQKEVARVIASFDVPVNQADLYMELTEAFDGGAIYLDRMTPKNREIVRKAFLRRRAEGKPVGRVYGLDDEPGPSA